MALVRRGILPTREKAQAAIMAGQVFIDGRRVCKSSETVLPDEILTIKSPEKKYVSRGALKLEKALNVFQADIRNKVVMDVGASTGGFTDVCLQNGAEHVFSVDVGYGQLDWKLRNDPRVTVMERTNARFLTREMFDRDIDIAVMDVSFISVRLILPAVIGVIGDEGVVYSLIKPQFEAGRGKVGKKGVVREAETHEEVIRTVADFVQTIGWKINNLDYSPITGPEGNIEFLAEIRKADEVKTSEPDISAVVAEAHRLLDH